MRAVVHERQATGEARAARLPVLDRRLLAAVLPLLATGLFVLAWWGLKVVSGWNDVILPSPAKVVSSIASNSQLLWRHGLVTLRETRSEERRVGKDAWKRSIAFRQLHTIKSTSCN